MQKAIFLDRDETLIVDTGFVHDPKDLQFHEGVIEALQIFQQKGYLLIVITNQSGIQRGHFTESQMHDFHEAMKRQLAHHDVELTAFYFCPHAPEENCKCRKPKTFLVEQAIRAFDVDRSQSYFIGDRESDVLCGQAAGLQTFLVTHREGGGILEFAKRTLKF